MTDRLTDAFNMLRQGGAVFAGRARLTNWSDNARGMNASFRLDASADPLDNPANHPFKGAHCSPKDGHEFLVLVIPVANGGGEIEPEPEQPVEEQGPHVGGEKAAEPRQTTNANRAGMMIREPLFWQWLNENMRQFGKVANADDANAVLCAACEVQRKRDLDVDLDAAAAFDRIRRAYYAWTQEPVA